MSSKMENDAESLNGLFGKFTPEDPESCPILEAREKCEKCQGTNSALECFTGCVFNMGAL